MPESPRISVIVATYNWSGVLRYAIESVLWQTWTDFELLVIGDGCTDDSAEVVASFRDPRIFWHNLPENSGHQSAPNNAGLARARGEFVAYLGHDDLWHPTHLAGLVGALEESGAAVAYSWLKMILPSALDARRITGISPDGEAEPRLSLPPSSLMHRRDFIEEIGGWKDYRTIAAVPDADFVFRIHKSGRRFVQVKQLSAFKFPATLRPDSYRDKPSQAQAEYVARMKSEPDFLVRELSDCMELVLRRHPEEITWSNPSPSRPQGEYIRQTRVVRGLEEREIAAPQFPLLPGARLRLAAPEAEPFLWHGWSHAEGDYRWTEADRVAITFAAPADVALRFTIELAPFLLSGKLEAQQVDVVLNGHDIAHLRLTTPELVVHMFELPAACLKLESVLELILPDAVSPINVGAGGDLRKLGLRAAWMEFEPAA